MSLTGSGIYITIQHTSDVENSFKSAQLELKVISLHISTLLPQKLGHKLCNLLWPLNHW
jgi:hypothetical protein